VVGTLRMGEGRGRRDATLIDDGTRSVGGGLDGPSDGKVRRQSRRSERSALTSAVPSRDLGLTRARGV
jgi:hypothetical protein